MVFLLNNIQMSSSIHILHPAEMSETALCLMYLTLLLSSSFYLTTLPSPASICMMLESDTIKMIQNCKIPGPLAFWQSFPIVTSKYYIIIYSLCQRVFSLFFVLFSVFTVSPFPTIFCFFIIYTKYNYNINI